MFQTTPKPLRNCYSHPFVLVVLALFMSLLNVVGMMARAAEKPEYLASFDPAKGFKPAQNDLTEIFLQIAGSLEYYGSPVPYMQHMQKEHTRVEALYLAKMGAAAKSYRPDYMTDAYLNRFAETWDTLSPKLGLSTLTKEIGNTMRDGITGTRNTGTLAVELFNEHQSRVAQAMQGKQVDGATYDALQTELFTRLDLEKEHIDDSDYSITRRDAERAAVYIQAVTRKLFSVFDQQLKPEDASRLKGVMP